MIREAWLIEYVSNGEPKREVHLHNAIADYRQIDPNATASRLDDMMLDAEALGEWLSVEMPAGTIIGDPRWWARHIVRHLSRGGV